MGVERTLAIIKPDAIAAELDSKILQLIESNGFEIEKLEEVTLTKERAEAFYGEHKGKPFFDALVAFMTSGPIAVLVLSKENAIKAWRDLMGPTNPETAKANAPNSVRALYGKDTTHNASHGSDSPQSAEREIKFFFP